MSVPADPTDEQRPAAVVVVNYRSHELVEAALAPLEGSGLHLVVVDNRSDDAERAAVTALAARRGWHLVLPEGNAGFGAGVNAGVTTARELGAAAHLLLNPDARIDAATALELLDHVRRRPWSLVSPRVLRPDGSTEFGGAFVDLADGQVRGHRWLRPTDEPELVLGPAALAEPHPAWRPWLTGACLAVSSELFTALGGFDESYFLYWEDVDLSVRAQQLGAALVLRQDLAVVHDEGGTQGERAGRAKSASYYAYNCRNRLLFGAQHLSPAELARWLGRTPDASWQVLLRGGRRQLLTSPSGALAALRGSASGAGLALGALLLDRRRSGRRAPLAAAGAPTTTTVTTTDARPPAPRVTVAVPTFRRTELLAGLLPVLLAEAERARVEGAASAVDVVVVDNDPDAGARATADAATGVRWVHEPSPGLSSARNRALDEAADVLVFCDDDELPEPGWLTGLLLAQHRTGAAAVASAVVPRYDRPPSRRVLAGEFFERPRHRTGTPLAAARTGGLLLDVAALRAAGLRFEAAYGTTGGEDTALTRALVRSGGRVVWCDEAVLVDPVPADRATLRWVLRRAYSAGNTAGRLALSDSARAAVALAGAGRATAGLARWGTAVLTRDLRGQASGLRTGARGAGLVAAAAGARTEEYSRG